MANSFPGSGLAYADSFSVGNASSVNSTLYVCSTCVQAVRIEHNYDQTNRHHNTLWLRANNAGCLEAASIGFTVVNNGGDHHRANIIATANDGSAGGNLALYTRRNDDSQDQLGLYINNIGNVSIGGQISPFVAPKVDIRTSCPLTSEVGQPLFLGSNDVTGPLGVVIQHLCGHGVCRVDITSTRYGVSGNDLSLNVDSSNPNTGGGLYIKYRGNVGIGIAEPIARLHVEQSTTGEVGRFRANVAGCADLVLVNNAQTWGWRVDNAASNALHVRNFQNTTNIMTFTTGGGVGIGTTSPATNLHICDANALGRDDMIRLTQGNVNNHAYVRSERCNGAMILMGATRNSFDGCIPSDSGVFWSFCNNPIIIGTCNRERIRVATTGNVGIGTSSPSNTLTVNGNIGLGGYNWMTRSDGDGNWGFGLCNNSSTYYTFLSYAPDPTADRRGGIFNIAGNSWIAYGNCCSHFIVTNSLGIGTTTPSYKLHVNGTFYAAGSSIDYKEGISQYDTDSCLFMCLKPKTYQYKDEWKHLGKDLKSGTQIGLIAEEVAEVMPELAVLVNEEENKVVRNVDYEKLSIILLSEVQKLRKEVDNLKNNK